MIAAAKKGYDEDHMEIVKLLLDAGANVNGTDCYGSSAVRQAEHKAYVDNMKSSIATYLCYYHGAGTNPGTDDISMDYDRACAFLRSNI